MSLNVSAWSIRTPVPALVFFAVVMLLGIVSFQMLPITRFPQHRRAGGGRHREPVGSRPGGA